MEEGGHKNLVLPYINVNQASSHEVKCWLPPSKTAFHSSYPLLATPGMNLLVFGHQVQFSLKFNQLKSKVVFLLDFSCKQAILCCLVSAQRSFLENKEKKKNTKHTFCLGLANWRKRTVC